MAAIGSSANEAQSRARAVVMGFMEQYVTEERALQGDQIRFMAEHKMGPNLEVIDPASWPASPAKPNRVTAASLGLIAGLLAGVAMSWWRRPRAPAITAMPQPI